MGLSSNEIASMLREYEDADVYSGMNHPEFSDLVEQIVLNGAQVAFEIQNPTIQRGCMYGILKEQDGRTAVSNILFETLIINYFVSVRSTYALTTSGYIEKGQYARKKDISILLWKAETKG